MKILYVIGRMHDIARNTHFVLQLSTDFKWRLVTSFCLQVTRLLYGNTAVSYLRKATDAKNFAAFLHKLTKRCLMNSYYDV